MYTLRGKIIQFRDFFFFLNEIQLLNFVLKLNHFSHRDVPCALNKGKK